MARTRIKMCGTTNPEDALAAVRAGVDGLGFIFVDKSPRNVEPDTARSITRLLPPFIHAVGVFVDRPVHEVVELVNHCRLTHIQLHGHEDFSYCKELERKGNRTLIKAFRVGPDTTATEFTDFDDVVQGFLLDTYKKGVAGGTGDTFDWTIIRRLHLKRPLILAGGLNPDNVREAIASVRPYAIDINSGVEKAPGIKDHDLLSGLIRQVRLLEASPDSKISGQ